MLGKILDYSRRSQQGMILGDDGQCYLFVEQQWQIEALPEAGIEVEFTAHRKDALAIRAPQVKQRSPLATAWFLPAQALLVLLAVLGVKRLLQQPPTRRTAAMLALLFGSLAIHKLYLGKLRSVLLLIVATSAGCLLLGPVALSLALGLMGLLGWIEAIRFLACTEAEFEQIYLVRRKAWF